MPKAPPPTYRPRVICHRCKVQMCRNPVEVLAIKGDAAPGLPLVGYLAASWRCDKCGGVILLPHGPNLGNDSCQEILTHATLETIKFKY